MSGKLFTPVDFGAIHLEHRVVMAPLTRCRATVPGNVPNALNVKYYEQRASPGGLLITEATQVVPEGQGYFATPGIHTDAQVEGWKPVTEAVHRKGGLIVMQLWHVGRSSHSSYQPGGKPPVAPSAIAISGSVMTAEGKMAPYETPRALETAEIAGVVEGYRAGAARAKAAGFDGVEIHAANGYLIDQFLQDATNHRTDQYGGSIENRARLLLEVFDAVASVWGANRVGVRVSPHGSFNDMRDSAPEALFTYAISQLSNRGAAYLHLIEPRASNSSRTGKLDDSAPNAAGLFGSAFKGPLLSAGGYDREGAIEAVETGKADAVAFGRWFISNPDLPYRLEKKLPLNAYDRSTFYGGTAVGYTDYPTANA